jgi:hypothetical protein
LITFLLFSHRLGYSLMPGDNEDVKADEPWDRMSRLGTIPLHERLALMVQYALPGTLIPVDSLRQLLEEDQPRAKAPGYSLEEVAERCAALASNGRTVQTSAVRKWIREGLRGVRLSAFPWGNTYRVGADELEEFIRAVSITPRRRPRPFPQRSTAESVRDEIASSRQRFAKARSRN